MSPKEFFCGSSLEAYGLVGGEHMTKTVGKKTFVLFADYSWGWQIRDAFIERAKANGGEIVGTLAVPLGTNDFQPFLTQLMSKDVDYAALVVNGGMFVNCMRQAYGLGLKDRMKFVTFQANIEEVNGCGPEAIKDVFVVADYFWNLPNDKNREFVNKYFAKYGTEKRPSMRTFAHYASVMMWADAVRKAGTVEPDKVAPALLGLKGGLWRRHDGNSKQRRPHDGQDPRCRSRQRPERDEGQVRHPRDRKTLYRRKLFLLRAGKRLVSRPSTRRSSAPILGWLRRLTLRTGFPAPMNRRRLCRLT